MKNNHILVDSCIVYQADQFYRAFKLSYMDNEIVSILVDWASHYCRACGFEPNDVYTYEEFVAKVKESYLHHLSVDRFCFNLPKEYYA